MQRSIKLLPLAENYSDTILIRDKYLDERFILHTSQQTNCMTASLSIPSPG